MPRRVQDIVPGNHRSVRDVPFDHGRGTSKPAPRSKEADREIPIHRKTAVPTIAKRTSITPQLALRPMVPRKNRLKWLIIALSIIMIVSIVGFIASSYYSRASFTIVPKVIPISVSGTYVAEAASATSSLSYEVVTVKGMASSTVVASDGPSISTKAFGKAVIYNSFTNQPVRLIAGTRLSSDSGLIYRLTSSVVIPGDTVSAEVTVPGKVSVGIVADQPGQDYNLLKADSTGNLDVVAYQGSPKYDSIYAKLSTDVSGGFVGVKKITSPTAVASTTAKLKVALTASLLSQAEAAVPDGYIMYDNSYASSFAPPVVSGSDKNLATISLQGSVYGIIFKKNDLVAKISSNQSRTSFGDFGYTSPGLESLQVAITNIKDFSPSKKNALVLHIQGSLKLVGTVPVADITKKLEGISLAGTQDVFKSYSAVIESGTGELVPPWAKIPSDSRRISVVVQGQ